MCRYVGNKIATLVMQSLGCDVAALNTVHFSESTYHVLSICSRLSIELTISGNHTGYKQFKGTKATAQEINDLYQGLCQSHLTDFDVMLSGYAPSAAAVEAVGAIGLDLQQKAQAKPGSFFWGMCLLCCFCIDPLTVSSVGPGHGGSGPVVCQ